MSISWLIFLLSGLPIGLSLGLIGGGGSIFAVPALVYLAHLDAHAATATSLLVVGLTAGLGALPHWRAGHVDLSTALSFTLASIPGAFLGAIINRRLPNTVVLLLFSLFMLVTSARMWWRHNTPQRPQTKANRQTHRSLIKIGSAGLGTGLLTGLFGAGGGFIIVPALVVILGFSIRDAVGTSLAIIALNSASAMVVHLHYGGLDARIAGTFGLSALLGVLIGARVARHLTEARIQQVFAILVAVLGISMVGNILHGFFA